MGSRGRLAGVCFSAAALAAADAECFEAAGVGSGLVSIGESLREPSGDTDLAESVSSPGFCAAPEAPAAAAPEAPAAAAPEAPAAAAPAAAAALRALSSDSREGPATDPPADRSDAGSAAGPAAFLAFARSQRNLKGSSKYLSGSPVGP